MTLFVDMDGVLADFDAHHAAHFGFRPDKLKDDVDWSAVRAIPDFYRSIPPMADMPVLWRAIENFDPIVLTGVPKSVSEATDNKRAWVAEHIGRHVEVRCCRSSEKHLHASPGDILIDDRDRYRLRWLRAGGIWITHRSAKDTVSELCAVIAHHFAPVPHHDLRDDALARCLHAAAQREHLLNDIRGWDRREWTDGPWENVAPGLTEEEKEKWRRVARSITHERT